MQINTINNGCNNLAFCSNILEQKKSIIFNKNNSNDELIKRTKRTIAECIFVALNLSVIYFAMKRAGKYKKIELFNLRQIRKSKLLAAKKDLSVKPFIGY